MTDNVVETAEHSLRMAKLAVAEEKAKTEDAACLAYFGRCPRYFGHFDHSSFVCGVLVGFGTAFFIIGIVSMIASHR